MDGGRTIGRLEVLCLMARGHASAARSGENGMDLAGKRGEIIRHLEDTLAIADEIEVEEAGYLI